MLAYMMFWVQSLADVTPNPGPSILIDLLDLQWWQTLIAVAGALGLSCAPWLLGVATGMVQFTAVAERAHEKALTERDRHWQALLELQKERYSDLEDATAIERERADKATDALVEMTEVVRASTHALNSLNQVAREVTDSDRAEHAG